MFNTAHISRNARGQKLDQAAPALAAFNPDLYYTDEVGDHVKMPDAGSKVPGTPLIMTVTNKWNDGFDKAQVAAALKAVGEKAMSVDGVYAFQYGINEEKKENVVTEVYADASVIGKFFAVIGDPAEAFKAITTTDTIACGPKEQVDMAGGALKDFSPTLYFTDDLSNTVQGFGDL